MKQELGEMRFENGWMGGRWELNGDGPVTHSSLQGKKLFIRMRGVELPAEVTTISGSDDDHGHVYNWTATDFLVELGTALGSMKVSLRRTLQRGESVVLVEELMKE